MGIMAAYLPANLPSYAQDTGQVLTKSTKNLTLDQAVNAALEHSPVLAADRSRYDAAAAARQQSGALPNPELSVEAENFMGDGPYEGFDAAEVTVGVSQLVELPGKRSNRMTVSEAEKTKASHSMKAARLDLIRDVIIAYSEAVTAQKEISILQEELNLAMAVRDSVAAKVEAGKEPPIQKNKAEIALSTTRIALDRADRNLTTRLAALKALMGNGVEAVRLDPDSLPALIAPLQFKDYAYRLSNTPDALTMESDIRRAKSLVSYEKASAVPDPTFNVGIKELGEDDGKAFIAGISIPIPVFNINRAGIERAGYELNAAKLDKNSGLLSLETQLYEAHEALMNAFHESQTLEKNILPGAEESFSYARQGYEAGKFGYLDVLDAQRTLFDARRQYIRAAMDYQKQRAIVERIAALNDHSTKKNEK